MTKAHKDGAPQISFTNWILGGPLIKKSGGRKRSLTTTAVSGSRKSSPVVEEKKKDEVIIAKEVEKTDEKNAAVVEEKKDGEKKEGDGEKEEDKKNETKAVSKVPTKTNRTWTTEEDTLLLSLKAAKKPIKEICPLMHASKKEINTRIKELQAANPESQTTTDGDPKKPSVENPGDNDTSNTELPDLAGLFDTDSAAPTTDSSSKKEPTKDTAADGDNKSRANPPSKEKASSPQPLAAEPAAVSTPEQTQAGRLKPDNIWSAADCEMLEWLERTYTEQKWLQLQSAFYNRTGRMVHADIIKLKFES